MRALPRRGRGRTAAALAAARVAVVVTIAVIALGGSAPAAQAHALVRSSVPAAGALLSRTPAAVTIVFTEPPDPALSFIHVLDPSSHDVERGTSGLVPGDSRALRVPLRPLAQGVYTVSWRAVSRIDGHLTTGSFSFGVGVAPPSAASSSGTPTTSSSFPSPLAVAGRWLFYWGLAVLLGATAARTLLFDDFPRGGTGLLVAAWVVAAAGLVAMIAAERSVVGGSLTALLSSSAGGRFVARAIAVGAAGLGVVAAIRWRGALATLPLAVATAAGMLVHAVAGHAGAVASAAWFDVLVQWLHLVAVGTWIGGLPWLLLALRRSRERRTVATRFATLATASLAIVLVTGAIRAVQEVGWPNEWRRLLDTSFGVALLVKLVLVAGLVAVGARNHYVHVPAAAREGATPTRLARAVTLEVVFAFLVLGSTAVLSELPPSATVAQARTRSAPPASLTVRGSDFATTVRVALIITPGTVGPDRFDAEVTDFDTGRPIAARAVSISLTVPGRPDLTQRVDLRRSGAGRWTAESTALSMQARWSATVLVEQATSSVDVTLAITPRLPPEKITVARAPGQPTVSTISVAGGRTLQTYVDPGRDGPNTVHFTFFGPSGDEIAIAAASASAVTPSGSPETLSLIRFDAGHFVANTSLARGRWLFSIRATPRSGAPVSAYFEQAIP